MCAYPSSKYALPHWKCVFNGCAKCSSSYLPIPESYHKNHHVSPTICFHAYQQISRCTVHGRRLFRKKSIVWGFLSFNGYCKNVYKKSDFHDGDINCWLPSTVLHTCNIEMFISLATCTHYWNISLWKFTPRGIQALCSFLRCILWSGLCITCGRQFSHQILV